MLIKNKGLHEAKLQEYFQNDTQLHIKEDNLQIIQETYGNGTEGEEDNKLSFNDSDRSKKHSKFNSKTRKECPKCPGKTFAPSTLANHIREVHNIGKHVDCLDTNCIVKFRKKSDMKKHFEIVHQNVKELCNICGESFKNLKYHNESVHQGIRYKCNDCAKEYKTEKMLNQHIESVHKLKRSICEICAVEVIDLKHHMKLNHEGPVEKLEPCPDANCTRKFRTSQEAKKHYRSYHLEIKEMCPICGGWFKALYQHTLAVHKNLKKHSCSDCGKAFSKKHDLQMHKNRVHLGIKYVCPHCGKQVSKLRDHIKLVHSNLMSSTKDMKPPKMVTNMTLDESLLTCQGAQDPNPVTNINDIIKRCVSNIDQQMVSGLTDNEGKSYQFLTSFTCYKLLIVVGLTNLMASVDSDTGTLTDFNSVYSVGQMGRPMYGEDQQLHDEDQQLPSGGNQLPSMDTVLQTRYRSKLEADNQDLLESVENNSSVSAESNTSINMYQWLQSSE